MLADEHRQRSDLRNIDLLVIAPSQRLDSLATEHVHHLPRNIRMVLCMLGDRQRRGLSSYLLFEKAYTGCLLDLGREDAQAHRDQVLRCGG
jgi:NTE family protein